MAPRHYRIVGAVLAAARSRAGLTQTEVAQRLSKPQSFVSSYERGQRRIDVLELIVIAEAVRADPAGVFAAVLRGHQKRGR